MFLWLRRIVRYSDTQLRQRFFKTLDAMNAEAGGGQPTVTTKVLGRLRLRSGTLAFADPQYVPGLEVSGIANNEVTISAQLWRYPSGSETVASVAFRLGDSPTGGSDRKVGEIAIDSAKLVVADKADIDECWTDVGKDRLGVISTAPDDTVLRMLSARFKLKTTQVNRVRAEVVGPVSEGLEQEIEDYLKSNPKYAQFPFMYFRVQTNNSFDRANYMEKAWEFMPIGNEPDPLMFVCETGRGDGCYEMFGEFAGESPRVLTIRFIES